MNNEIPCGPNLIAKVQQPPLELTDKEAVWLAMVLSEEEERQRWAGLDNALALSIVQERRHIVTPLTRPMTSPSCATGAPSHAMAVGAATVHRPPQQRVGRDSAGANLSFS
jgi:hypothetical protein